MMWLVVSLINLLNTLASPNWLTAIPSTTEIAHVWETMQPASCMPDNCFCEPVVSGLIRQPINTWTNLAFILSGTLALIVAACDLFVNKSDSKTSNLMRTQWIYPAVYGYTAVLIGLGSMLYHATMVFYGQVADILSMYLLSSFMVLYNLSRAWKMKGWQFFTLFFVTNIVLGSVSTMWPEYRRPIFVGILFAVLLSEMFVRMKTTTRMDMKMFWAAMGSLVVGCTAWILDISGLFCMPNSWFQLHSVWHIGMAAAIWFVYLYYRSEKNHPEQLNPGLENNTLEVEPC